MALWGGWQAYLGRRDPEGHRRFYHRFGTDIASAMTLNSRDAADLTARIIGDLDRHNIRGIS
jgi:phage gp37-like protein